MSQPGRYTFAVDWDNTCVKERWPEMGEWLPGATAGLKALAKIGPVVINTLRVCPTEVDGITWRDPADTAAQVQAIRHKLDRARLQAVDIWTRHWKVPARFYIDDRNFPHPFDGDWPALVAKAQAVVNPNVHQIGEEFISA